MEQEVFPIELSKLKPLKLDPSVTSLSDETKANLQHNIQLCRDAIVFFTALAGAKVLTIARTQELLASDEALVYFADDGVHIHAFFITKDRAAWMPLALTSPTIADHVEALRCGLDATSWFDDRADRCFKLVHINYSEDDLQRGEDLPFDLGRAHELYQALFGTQKRGSGNPELDVMEHEPASDEPGPEALAQAEELQALLHAVLADLPPREQQIVELRLAGHTYEEIEHALGTSVYRVRTALDRVKRRLAKWLED